MKNLKVNLPPSSLGRIHRGSAPTFQSLWRPPPRHPTPCQRPPGKRTSGCIMCKHASKLYIKIVTNNNKNKKRCSKIQYRLRGCRVATGWPIANWWCHRRRASACNFSWWTAWPTLWPRRGIPSCILVPINYPWDLQKRFHLHQNLYLIPKGLVGNYVGDLTTWTILNRVILAVQPLMLSTQHGELGPMRV